MLGKIIYGNYQFVRFVGEERFQCGFFFVFDWYGGYIACVTMVFNYGFSYYVYQVLYYCQCIRFYIIVSVSRFFQMFQIYNLIIFILYIYLNIVIKNI